MAKRHFFRLFVEEKIVFHIFYSVRMRYLTVGLLLIVIASCEYFAPACWLIYRVHNYINIPNLFEVTAHSYYEAGYSVGFLILCVRYSSVNRPPISSSTISPRMKRCRRNWFHFIIQRKDWSGTCILSIRTYIVSFSYYFLDACLPELYGRASRSCWWFGNAVLSVVP